MPRGLSNAPSSNSEERNDMETPEELLYSDQHEWVRNEDGEVRMGITDFAQTELTDIVFVELPEVGREVSKGDELVVVESVKAVSDVYAPVSGTVTAVNEALEEAPELVNQSPFGDGWMVKIKMSDPAELDLLMSAGKYIDFVENRD